MTYLPGIRSNYTPTAPATPAPATPAAPAPRPARPRPPLTYEEAERQWISTVRRHARAYAMASIFCTGICGAATKQHTLEGTR